MTSATRKYVRWALGMSAVLFGVVTVASGGRVLFDPAARASAGDVVGFVLIFNFSAGFAYVAAGLGTLLRRAWAPRLAIVLAASTLLVFAVFGVHVLLGGGFENRTVMAMTARSAFWIVQAVVWIRLPALIRNEMKGAVP